MRPDTRKYLWDALYAAELIHDFAHGRSFVDYQSNAMVRSAVERQFEIIGEALNQFFKVDPETASRIPELPRIVAFRNILIHGYATVDDALVWQVLIDKLPDLRQARTTLCAHEWAWWSWVIRTSPECSGWRSPRPGWQSTGCSANAKAARTETQRDVTASLAPSATKEPAKMRRIQVITRGRETTWFRTAAANTP